MIDGLSPDNPFFLARPTIEKAGLQRNVTKEQCVDFATRIAYGMCQQLYEALNTQFEKKIDALNAAHTEAIQTLADALRAEMHP